MRTTTTTLTLVFLLALAALPSFAADRLLPPTTGDLVSETVVALENQKNLRAVSHDAVKFAWKLTPDEVLALRPELPSAVSRSYHLLVTAADLSQGLAIATTAPGAVVRINPAPSSDTMAGAPLDPAKMTMIAPDGTEYRSSDATSTLVDADAMKQAGSPFAEGTSAFRLAPRLGHGLFHVKHADLGHRSDDRFAVHVFEPESAIVLEARPSRSSYLSGDTMIAEFSLKGASNPEVASVTVSLRTPDGTSVPATISDRAADTITVEATLPMTTSRSTGLWEVHATVEANAEGMSIRRNVHSAFAVAAPTARYTGIVKFARADGGLTAALQVETANPGRYEARAVLVAVSSDGRVQPLSAAHSGAYFPTGVSELVLEFPEVELSPASRLELRDLQLLDQGRLGELHRQAVAAVVR